MGMSLCRKGLRHTHVGFLKGPLVVMCRPSSPLNKCEKLNALLTAHSRDDEFSLPEETVSILIRGHDGTSFKIHARSVSQKTRLSSCVIQVHAGELKEFRAKLDALIAHLRDDKCITRIERATMNEASAVISDTLESRRVSTI